MNSSHESTLGHLRARVLILAWLIAPLMGAMSDAAHATPTGTVVAWGHNTYGQVDIPVGLTGVRAIAAGEFHTAVVRKRDRTVVAWGRSAEGQTNVPVGLSGIRAIAAADAHTVALKHDGTVVAWGDNFYGQTKVPAGLSDVMAVAAGHIHTVALKRDGTVVAWGDNTFGQTNVPGAARHHGHRRGIPHAGAQEQLQLRRLCRSGERTADREHAQGRCGSAGEVQSGWQQRARHLCQGVPGFTEGLVPPRRSH